MAKTDRYEYDENGNLIEVIKEETTFTYDSEGKLVQYNTEIRWYDGTETLPLGDGMWAVPLSTLWGGVSLERRV